MASMPVRIDSLAETVRSILPQCDILNIYLNDYRHIPEYLNHEKIKVFMSDQHNGDLGDVGKFFRCNTWKDDYIFTVDDKLIYPSNYSEVMIRAIETYGRKAVISLHGRMLKPVTKSYYHDAQRYFRCLDHVMEDTFAHVLGTGVMAFHGSLFKVKLQHFKSTNMSDIWMSIALQKAGIPILILKHRAGWIKISRRQDNRLSISAQCSSNDKPQTDAVNSVKWQVFTCPSVL